MSDRLKKELQEALDVLENKSNPIEDKEKSDMIEKGKLNGVIRRKFQTKGWCFTGDHPIIDVEGGE